MSTIMADNNTSTSSMLGFQVLGKLILEELKLIRIEIKEEVRKLGADLRHSFISDFAQYHQNDELPQENEIADKVNVVKKSSSPQQPDNYLTSQYKHLNASRPTFELNALNSISNTKFTEMSRSRKRVMSEDSNEDATQNCLLLSETCGKKAVEVIKLPEKNKTCGKFTSALKKIDCVIEESQPFHDFVEAGNSGNLVSGETADNSISLKNEEFTMAVAEVIPLSALHDGSGDEEIPSSVVNSNSNIETIANMFLSQVKTPNGDTFVCKFCNKDFQHMSSFRRHMRVHTGEKPFSCEICGRKFSLKGNLQKHLLVHTDQRPFVCHICQKRFVRKSSLLSHVLIHTTYGQSFKCDMCDKSFKQHSHLKEHRLTHVD